MYLRIVDKDKEVYVNLAGKILWQDDFNDNSLDPNYEPGSAYNCGSGTGVTEQNGRLEIRAVGSGGQCSTFVWLNNVPIPKNSRIEIEVDITTVSLTNSPTASVFIQLYKQKDYTGGDKITIHMQSYKVVIYKRVGGTSVKYYENTEETYPGDGHYKFVFDLKNQRIQVYKDGNLLYDIDTSSDPFTSDVDLIFNMGATADQDGYDVTVAFDNLVISVEAGVFQITSYPTSIQVSPGASITVNTTVVNNGDVSGTVEVRLRDHNNNIVASKQISLDAGASQSLSLTATAPSTAGAYSWKIEAYNVDTGTVDDSKSFTVQVSGIAVSDVFNQLIQTLVQLLPFIILLIIVSLLVAALK